MIAPIEPNRRASATMGKYSNKHGREYIVVDPRGDFGFDWHSMGIIRLKDGHHSSNINWSELNEEERSISYDSRRSMWTKTGRYLYYSNRGINCVWMDEDGKVHGASFHSFPLGENIGLTPPGLDALPISPDHRFIITARSKVDWNLSVIDITECRRVKEIVPGWRKVWWQSDNVIGVMTSEGKREFIRVGDDIKPAVEGKVKADE